MKRHSRSVDPERHCCGSCKGKLLEIEVPGKSSSAKETKNIFTPKKKREPSAFSLFVKENSASVRVDLMKQAGKSVPQSEVMKECGRLWRQQKESQKSTNQKTISIQKESDVTVNKIGSHFDSLTIKE